MGSTLQPAHPLVMEARFAHPLHHFHVLALLLPRSMLYI